MTLDLRLHLVVQDGQLRSQLTPLTEEDEKTLAETPRLIESVIVSLVWEALSRECLLTKLSSQRWELSSEEIGGLASTNLSALLGKIANKVAEQAIADLEGGLNAKD